MIAKLRYLFREHATKNLVLFFCPEKMVAFAKPPDATGLKWKFLIYKNFFDTGYSLTNYLKYGIAIFGLASRNVSQTVLIAILYAVACNVIGFFWFRYKFAELNNEIGNRLNWFVTEMRNKINK